MSKVPEYTYEYTLPVRAVIEELRRNNAGNKRAYLRFRSTFYTYHWRPLIPGAERTLAQAAASSLQQVGGRLIRFAAGKHFLEVEFLLPESESLHHANTVVRRSTSIAYKRAHKGIGSEDSNGFLWNPHTISETVPPLLDTPRRFRTETL